jgi:iron complex transport system substrate-binding protein
VATLLMDAGADYLWKDDANSGSLPLSFEQVFARAKDAEYWINLSTVKSKAELLSFEQRYSEFRAFREGNLFNNTLHTNTHGYSDYWETGICHPERILWDLINIFHPSAEAQVKRELYYYEKIK